jgi:hypothetical protein
MTRRIVLLIPIILVSAGLVAGATAAGEARKPPSALPGVESPAPIVAPVPEPPDRPQTSGPRRIGNWDVTVSGHVRVQIGTSGPMRRD